MDTHGEFPPSFPAQNRPRALCRKLRTADCWRLSRHILPGVKSQRTKDPSPVRSRRTAAFVVCIALSNHIAMPPTPLGDVFLDANTAMHAKHIEIHSSKAAKRCQYPACGKEKWERRGDAPYLKNAVWARKWVCHRWFPFRENLYGTSINNQKTLAAS